jgi:hypothetical protein
MKTMGIQASMYFSTISILWRLNDDTFNNTKYLMPDFQYKWFQNLFASQFWPSCQEVLRARAKITWQISRSDLGWIWSIRLSKTTGIASYFEDFASEYRPKMA